MSLSHSPQIVTTGLTSYVDVGNTQKSWFGAPSTNLITYSQDFTNAGWVKSSANVFATVGSAPDGTNTAFMLQDSGSAPGVVQHWVISSIFTTTANTVVTASVYLKAGTQAQARVLLYDGTLAWIGADAIDLTNGSAPTGISQNATLISHSLVAVGNGWFRYSVTGSLTTTSYRIIVNINYGGVAYTGTGLTSILMWGPQLELGSYATTYIPTTSAAVTRSTTQSLVDLTGLNTYTVVGNVVTNTDGTLGFNGTTGTYISTPPSSNVSFPTNIFTIEYWVYFNSIAAGQSHGIIGKGGSAWEYAIYTPTTGNLLYLYTWNTSGSNPVYGNQLTIGAANTWYHHCWVADGTSAYVYINGVLINSTSPKNGLSTMGTGSNNLTIGAGGDGSGFRYLNGKLGSVKTYNRALSATEVQQNFEAHRGRYGI
jgi:hypothetical protein